MTEQKGFPIYLDQTNRQFTDSASERIEVTDWHPSNPSAVHLCRCLESLKDIANLLHGSAILAGDEEKRRRIKILVTPLYSLCSAIRDFCNYIGSSPELKNQLEKQKKIEAKQWLDDFLLVVPIDKSSAIRGIRDQISAHVDKLRPVEAQEIFAKAQNHEIGGWLYQCIVILSKLLSLHIFSWTTGDCPEGYVRFMMIEPWLLTFRLEDGKPVGRPNIHIANSPTNSIWKTLEEIAETSQWMLRPEDPRIIFSKSEPTDNLVTSNNPDTSKQT